MRKRLIVFVLLLVVLDQLSKWLAQTYLPFHEAVEVIPFFSLYLTYNTGIAFSMLSSFGSTGLIALSVVIIGVMIVMWKRLPPDHQLASLGFSLVIAGALGNLIDRMTQGHVIDYFLFHTSTWAFAVFNVADSFITLGAICIIVDEIVSARRKPELDSATEPTQKF